MLWTEKIKKFTDKLIKKHSLNELREIRDNVQAEITRLEGTYPEYMTVNKFYKKFEGKYKEFDDVEKAVDYLKEDKENRQIYTEIHGDSGDTLYYDRGFHHVNRTGCYAVVNDPQYTAMTYTGLDD